MVKSYTISDNRAHGHDCHSHWNQDGVAFVAVADGTSHSQDAAKAARLAVKAAKACFIEDPHQTISSFRDRLVDRLRSGSRPKGLSNSSDTTLSVAILEEKTVGVGTLSYFASGDSPIYVASPGPISPDLPGTFWTFLVHGAPQLVGNCLNSYLNARSGLFVGRVAVGSFELNVGEVCLVCSDGVDIFSRHILYDRAGCHWFLNSIVREDLRQPTEQLIELLSADGLNDDATIGVLVVKNRKRAHKSKSSNTSLESREHSVQVIEKLAYHIFQLRHDLGVGGTPDDDWHEARRILGLCGTYV
jgi:serine/threonine protein phosphatase PrpC